MNRDTIIGFALIAVVLIGFSWYNQPSAEEIEAARKQDSIAAVMKEKAAKEQKVAAQKEQKAVTTDSISEDTTALFHQAMSGTSQKVVLKNSKLELTLDTKGGVIRKAVIKDFKSIDGTNNVTLFDENDQNLNFMLAGKQDNIVTANLYFTPSELTDSTATFTAA
ncbi:MAG: YidC/Oxa1 family insertase periplasmic-domain containing protein, partial [Bacteroidaceae bacterium]|nr:YidC/Oxa1 family insertase periplasmic-domain containing protein [Bacteroidaceae bacterium]